MADDLEDDWKTLGRPGKIQRTITKVKDRSVGFVDFLFKLLDFLFGWIGRAWTAVWETFIDVRIWLTLFGIVALTGFCVGVYLSAKSDGRIDYCYVDKTANGSVSLIGHRPWSLNADLRTLKGDETVDVLYKTAKEIDCPIR